MLERDVQKSVVEFARRNDVVAHKFSSEARRNVPDYLFLFNGRVLFIEFKATGKRARKGQLREINKLRRVGFFVEVCDCKAMGRSLIRAFMQNVLI